MAKMDMETDMQRALLALMAALVLPACAMQPTRVEETNPMVSYNYEPGQVEETEIRAAEYCRERYDRDAHLVSRAEGARGELVANYECRSD